MKKGRHFIKIHKNFWLFLGIIFILFIFPIVFFSIFIVNFYLRIYPNVYVGSVNVGTLNEEQAIKKVNDTYKFRDSLSVSIIGTSGTTQIKPSDIEIIYKTKDIVHDAYKIGRSGNLIFDISKIITSFIHKRSFEIEPSLNQEKLDKVVSELNSQITDPPIYPLFNTISGEVNVAKGQAGHVVTVSNAKDTITQAFKNQDKETVITPSIEDPSLSDPELEISKDRAASVFPLNITIKVDDFNFIITKLKLISLLNPKGGYFETKIDELVGALAKDINRDPQNPIFKFENERVSEFLPAKDGLLVDQIELKKLIILSISNLEQTQKSQEIEAPVTRSSPVSQTGDVNNLGIKELIGRGTSKFAGSIPSRLHNVALASSKINGVLVAPNEVFSFAKIVGDVSKLTGYKEAYIIQNGRTILGDGGGVCQVSTTLFRAVMNAGLPIIERHAHAYRVGYYEQDAPAGYDATVYVPSVDFKFKNDTQNYILIQTKVNTKNQTAEFSIYGTSDGRVATISKPVLTNQAPPPDDLYIDDPTLPIGKVNQVEHKAWGGTSTFFYTVKRNGEELFTKKFVSVYVPWRAVFMKGTGTF